MKAHLWDVLQRQNILYKDHFLIYLVPIELPNLPCANLTALPFTCLKMPAKKKPRPLHVSLYHLAEERRNVQLRTQARITSLLASSMPPDEASIRVPVPVPVPIQQSGLSLNVIVLCFCTLLLTLNLIFLLWAYIQVTIHVNVKQV